MKYLCCYHSCSRNRIYVLYSPACCWRFWLLSILQLSEWVCTFSYPVFTTELIIVDLVEWDRYRFWIYLWVVWSDIETFVECMSLFGYWWLVFFFLRMIRLCFPFIWQWYWFHFIPHTRPSLRSSCFTFVSLFCFYFVLSVLCWGNFCWIVVSSELFRRPFFFCF